MEWGRPVFQVYRGKGPAHCLKCKGLIRPGENSVACLSRRRVVARFCSSDCQVEYAMAIKYGPDYGIPSES